MSRVASQRATTASGARPLPGSPRPGRPVEIDMHGKGLDHTMIQIARESGMPMAASPKYLAEHMGLPYHQSAIREKEYPRGGAQQPRAAEHGLAQVPALQLRRPADQGQGLQGHLPHLGGHSARAALGRSRLRRRLWAQLDVCGLRRCGVVRAAELQGPDGHRNPRRPLQLPEARHADPLRLAEIYLPVSRLGPAALLPGSAARQLDAPAAQRMR